MDRFLIRADDLTVRTDQFPIQSDRFLIQSDRFPIRMGWFADPYVAEDGQRSVENKMQPRAPTFQMGGLDRVSLQSLVAFLGDIRDSRISP